MAVNHNKCKQLLKNLLKMPQRISYVLLAILLLADMSTAAAGAVAVVESVQNTVGTLRNKAKELDDKRNNKIHLERVKQWLQANRGYYQKALLVQESLPKELGIAQQDLQIAAQQASESQKQAAAAQYLRAAGYEITDTDKLITQIDAEIKDLAQAEQALQDSAIDLNNRYIAELSSLRSQVEHKKEGLAEQLLAASDYDEHELETVATKLEAAVSSELAAVSAQERLAQERLAAAQLQLSAISRQLTELQRRREAAQLVHSYAERSKYFKVMENYVAGLERDIADNQEYLWTLRQEYSKLQTELEAVQQRLQPITAARYANSQTRLYTWRGSKGDSGQQFYQPIGLYMLQGNTEIGLYSGYINSRVNDAGSFSGLTDTLLYLGKISRVGQYTVNYMLYFSLPTGKSQISANSIVSDDLVEYSRLGEGFNWIPGISVSKQVSEEDSWSAQLLYNIRGGFNYDSNMPAAHINPGNELSESISWQHIGRKSQFLSRIIHTTYAMTEDNHISYRKGNSYDIQETYNRVLTPQDDLMLYYWFAVGGKNNYYSPLQFDPGGGLYRHYFGMQWLHKLNARSKFSVMVNTMLSHGNNYDPLTHLSMSRRNKYGLRLGYYMQLSPTNQISLQVEHYYLRDQGSSYRGTNCYFVYAKSI